MQDRGLPSCRLLQSHVGAVGATARPTSQTGTQAEGGLAACTDYSAGKGQPWRHIAHLSASSFSTRGAGGLGICPENHLFNPVLPLLVKGTEEPGEARPHGLGDFVSILHLPLPPSTARIKPLVCPTGSQKSAGNMCPSCCRQMSALGNICARPGRLQQW